MLLEKLFLIIGIIKLTEGSNCPIENSFYESTQIVINKSSDSETCFEYFVGSVFKRQLIVLAILENSINCDKDNLIILNSNRNICFDFCKNSTTSPAKISKFWTEDFYLIIKINFTSSAEFVTRINLFIIDFTKPFISQVSSTSIMTSPITTKKNDQSDLTCGKTFYNFARIIGGIEATPNSWPWQVYLTDGNKFCGGALLDDQWIITASHCVVSPYWKAYLGYHDIRFISKIKERRISKIIKHKDFNSSNYKNDIALFKLQTRVNFSNEIKPICLPNTNMADVGKDAIVVGWGKISNEGVMSNQLQQAAVKIKDNLECNFYNLDRTQICAGITEVNNIKDSCQGDSGSPLFTREGSTYFLTGIVSFGRSICDGYGVYTNIYQFLDWIRDTMNSN